MGKNGGKRPGAGRPRGRKQSFPTFQDIRKSVEEVFVARGGSAGLLAWSKEHPTEFYRLAGKLIPAEVQFSGRTLEQILGAARLQYGAPPPQLPVLVDGIEVFTAAAALEAARADEED